MPPFKHSYWQALTTFQIPKAVINPNSLILNSSSITVFIPLLSLAKGKEGTSSVHIGTEALAQRSGCSLPTVSRGVKGLVEQGFVSVTPTRKQKGKVIGKNEYLFLHPEDRRILTAQSGWLYNQNEIPYFSLPLAIVRESVTRWCWRNLSPNERVLYVTLGWLANRERGLGVTLPLHKIQKYADIIDIRTFQRAMAGLESKGLIFRNSELTELNDPYTGSPVVAPASYSDDPQTYYQPTQDGTKRRRINSNLEWTAKQLENFLVELGVQLGEWNASGHELSVVCPFHPDLNPSCSVNRVKSIYRCFGCPAKGTVQQMAERLAEKKSLPAPALIAKALGLAYEQRDPRPAFEVYTYRADDIYNTPVRRLLRHREDHSKKFVEHYVKGKGWLLGVGKSGPLLYNAHKLNRANVKIIGLELCEPKLEQGYTIEPVTTVAFLEGEPDAECFTRLGLLDSTSGVPIPGTTSGGAGSWVDALADKLIGKRVLVLPHADDAGTQFCQSVEKSLRAREIEYQVKLFPGAKKLSEYISQGHSKGDVAGCCGDWVALRPPNSYLDV